MLWYLGTHFWKNFFKKKKKGEVLIGTLKVWIKSDFVITSNHTPHTKGLSMHLSQIHNPLSHSPRSKTAVSSSSFTALLRILGVHLQVHRFLTARDHYGYCSLPNTNKTDLKPSPSTIIPSLWVTEFIRKTATTDLHFK